MSPYEPVMVNSQPTKAEFYCPFWRPLNPMHIDKCKLVKARPSSMLHWHWNPPMNFAGVDVATRAMPKLLFTPQPHEYITCKFHNPLELWVKSTGLHPVFGPGFTPYPLFL
jgi:hypothetical protein